MSQNTTPTVMVGNEGKTPRNRNSFQTKLMPFFVVSIALLVVVLLGFFIYNKVTNHPVTIGGTTVTPRQVNELAGEIQQYTKRNKSISFGGSPHKVARDDLILNAALKDQAVQRDVSVTNADVDAVQIPQYQTYGSKTDYTQFVQAEGITQLTRVTAENNAYKAKLENDIIAKKSLFVAAIIYDTPYVNNSKDPAALRAQALQTMQTKFLPLFQQNKSSDQITAQADITPGKPITNGATGPYFTSMPSTVFSAAGCTTEKPCFHDIKSKQLAGLPPAVSTQDAINKLTTVGQNTGVINSEAGFVGVIRLAGKTSGSYNSWGQFLQSYEKKYADGNLAMAKPLGNHIATAVHSAAQSLTSVIRQAGALLMPKASADAGCTDNSNHLVNLDIHATDQSGANLNGANVVESRPHAACPNGSGVFIGDDNGVNNHGNTGRDGPGELDFNDNCYNSSPNFAQTAPSGYQLSYVYVHDTLGDNSTMIVGNNFNGPITEGNAINKAVNDSGIWTNGILNAAGSLTIELHYKQKPPVQMPSGNVNAQCGQDQIHVTGVSDGSGSGGHFYVQLTSNGGSTPNYFPTGGGSYNSASQDINVPAWVQNRTGNSDVGVQLWVQSAGTGNYVNVNNANIGEPWSKCQPPPNNPNGETCPSFPTDPVDINLDNHDIPGSDNFNPGGSSSPRYKQAHIYTPKGLYHISTVYDNWGQDISSPNPHWSPQDGNNPNPFHINYSPFIEQYPYDTHTVTVSYKAFYTDDTYAANGAYHPRAGTWDWILKSTTTDDVSSTKPGQTINPCYPRGFQVQQPPLNIQLGDTYENPSHASFGFTVPVNFFLPNAQTALRNPMKICGLTYSADYYIKNAAGANVGALPGRASDGGPVPGGCINSSGSPNGSGSASWNTGPYGTGNLHAGDEVCVNFSVSPGGDRMDENGSPLNNTGAVTATQCSAPVVNEPYFKVYNSGIATGGDFGKCGGDGGLLEGWNDNTGADRGSSSQLSALALVKSTGVASAQTVAGRSPTDLTFANTGPGIPISADGQSPDLGGAFGGEGCLTDVSVPTNAVGEANNNPGVNTLGDGSHQYQSGGNVTLSGGTVASGKNIGVFVTNRDVYITKSGGSNGITYSAGPWSATATGTSVPSFSLVVTGGNIYIDPNITELDGMYVAQKNTSGRGGTIFTCGSTNGSVFTPMAASGLYSNCSQQLTVYGAFVANQVNLMRTYGSLRDAQAGELPGGAGHTCDSSGGASNQPVCAGEVFRFSPELYLSRQAIAPPIRGSLIETARTSLPPVL